MRIAPSNYIKHHQTTKTHLQICSSTWNSSSRTMARRGRRPLTVARSFFASIGHRSKGPRRPPRRGMGPNRSSRVLGKRVLGAQTMSRAGGGSLQICVSVWDAFLTQVDWSCVPAIQLPPSMGLQQLHACSIHG